MKTQDFTQAFLQVIDKEQGIIHKVCNMYRREVDDRKDLFQEIVIQLWKAFPNFRHEAKITTWMYRIALNTAISDYRKQKKRPETSEISDRISETFKPEEDTVKEENMQLLYAAIEKLTDVEKAVVMLYLEEHSYEEMADIVGITQNNLRVKMNRIREKLRKIMNPEKLWN
ncbi:MAG: sigma-70 family RNA polymerase sigma factor [Verrucomicrobia bacterium]|nr:sigma-70 family RNA polymerase sigma factor [Cytophagales bacterium]